MGKKGAMRSQAHLGMVLGLGPLGGTETFGSWQGGGGGRTGERGGRTGGRGGPGRGQRFLRQRGSPPNPLSLPQCPSIELGSYSSEPPVPNQ